MSDAIKESEPLGEVVVDNSIAVPMTSNVYMVYSKLSLTQLHMDLLRYGTIGLLRIVLDGDGRETTRNIAIFHDDVYQRLLADGYGDRNRWNKDLSVHPFEVKEFDLPGPGKTQTLFVPVPNELLTTDSVVRKEIVDKLQHLVDWEVIPPACWKLIIPLKSREHGGIRGGLLIAFRGLDVNHIALVRVALMDTRWDCLADENEYNHHVFRCYWARDRDEDGKATSKVARSPKVERSPKLPRVERSPKGKKERRGPKPPKAKTPVPTHPQKERKVRKSPKSPKVPKDTVELQTVAMPVAPQPVLITLKEVPTASTVPIEPIPVMPTVPVPPVVVPTVPVVPTPPVPPVVVPTPPVPPVVGRVPAVPLPPVTKLVVPPVPPPVAATGN
jgi:hypothetical protein